MNSVLGGRQVWPLCQSHMQQFIVGNLSPSKSYRLEALRQASSFLVPTFDSLPLLRMKERRWCLRGNLELYLPFCSSLRRVAATGTCEPGCHSAHEPE